jgi:hypothetical protein
MNIKEAMILYEDKLKALPNVWFVAIGKKIIDGKMTDKDCIVVFVTKKVEEAKLKATQIVPKEVVNFCTDVVELRTKDYTLGITDVSEKPWAVRKILASGVRQE